MQRRDKWADALQSLVSVVDRNLPEVKLHRGTYPVFRDSFEQAP